MGDNWVADIGGAAGAGIRAVHIWRHEEHPGTWLPQAPDDFDAATVTRIRSLEALLSPPGPRLGPEG